MPGRAGVLGALDGLQRGGDAPRRRGRPGARPPPAPSPAGRAGATTRRRGPGRARGPARAGTAPRRASSRPTASEARPTSASKAASPLPSVRSSASRSLARATACRPSWRWTLAMVAPASAANSRRSGGRVGCPTGLDERRQDGQRAAVPAAGAERDAEQPARGGHLGRAALRLGEDDGLLERADRGGRLAVEGGVLTGREQAGEVVPGRGHARRLGQARPGSARRVTRRAPARRARRRAAGRRRRVTRRGRSRPAQPGPPTTTAVAGRVTGSASSTAGSPVCSQLRPEEQHGGAGTPHGRLQRGGGIDGPSERVATPRSASPADSACSGSACQSSGAQDSSTGRRSGGSTAVRAHLAQRRRRCRLRQQVLDLDALAGGGPARADGDEQRPQDVRPRCAARRAGRPARGPAPVTAPASSAMAARPSPRTAASAPGSGSTLPPGPPGRRRSTSPPSRSGSGAVGRRLEQRRGEDDAGGLGRRHALQDQAAHGREPVEVGGCCTGGARRTRARSGPGRTAGPRCAAWRVRRRAGGRRRPRSAAAPRAARTARPAGASARCPPAKDGGAACCCTSRARRRRGAVALSRSRFTAEG